MKGWKELWDLKVIPKVRNFIWRACNNALATSENLVRKTRRGSPECLRCGCEVESIEHVLFFCLFARAVWTATGFHYYPNPIGFASMKQWWDNIASSFPSSGVYCSKSLVVLVCWHIWKARNKVVFDSIQGNPIDTWLIALREYQSSFDIIPGRQGDSNPNTNSATVSWNPPMSGIIKCNTDASRDPCTGMFGLGVVYRDYNGLIIGGLCDLVYAADRETAEALAVKAAVSKAKSDGWEAIEFESDNINVIRSVNGSEDNANWRTKPIIKAIKSMSMSFSYVSFSYIPRKCNVVADFVAKLTRTMVLVIGLRTSLLNC